MDAKVKRGSPEPCAPDSASLHLASYLDDIKLYPGLIVLFDGIFDLPLTFNRKIGSFRGITRKEFMDKFFDLCKDAQEEIPPNVIVEILRDYADRLD